MRSSFVWDCVVVIGWGIEVGHRVSPDVQYQQCDWNCWIDSHWPATTETHSACMFERNSNSEEFAGQTGIVARRLEGDFDS